MQPPYQTTVLRALTTATLLLGLLLLSSTSQAQETDQPILLQVYAGFIGDSEVDDLEVEGTDAADPEPEDLESQFGIAGMYLPLVAPQLRVGGRFAYLTAEGDNDSADNHYADFALGAWLRYEFVPGKARPFGDAGLGLNLLFINGDNLEANGIGLHLMVGGGVAFSVSEAVSLHVALYYGYEQYPSMSGEVDLGILGQWDVQGDLSLQRGLFAFGVQF